MGSKIQLARTTVHASGVAAAGGIAASLDGIIAARTAGTAG